MKAGHHITGGFFATHLFAVLGAALLIASTAGAQPVITSQPTNQAAFMGSNVVFSVAVSGTGPFTYQWRLNGTNLPNRNNFITRAAGGGSGYDGSVATSAQLQGPTGVAIDSSGDLFITGSFLVRMVDTNFVGTTNGPIGIIHTVAGNNSSAYTDGVTATNSGMYTGAVAVDNSGNFYVCDTGNCLIHKVDTNDITTTIAGIYGPGTTVNSGFSGDGGPAINAKLNFPSGIAVDNWGNIFIADQSNYRIRKIDTNGII
jgi:hypothetical protein